MVVVLLLGQSFGFDPAFIGGGLYPEEGFSSPVVEWFVPELSLGLYLSGKGG